MMTSMGLACPYPQSIKEDESLQRAKYLVDPFSLKKSHSLENLLELPTHEEDERAVFNMPPKMKNQLVEVSIASISCS